MNKWIKKIVDDLEYSLYLMLIILPLLLGILFISHRTQGWEISDSNLIITFLGVLATFVVVSNFSQVSSIEEKTEKAIEKYEKQIKALVDKEDDNSHVNRLKRLEDDLSKLNAKGEFSTAEEIVQKSVEETMKSIKDEINREGENNRRELEIRSLQMLRMADALINSSYKSILNKLIADLDSQFRVSWEKNGKLKENIAYIRFQDNRIQFVSGSGKTTFENVRKIDGISYSSEKMDDVLIYIIEATNKTRVYKQSAPADGNDDQIG